MDAATLALLILTCLTPPSLAPQPPPVKATLQDIAWLAGNWAGTRGRASIEERWTPPGGGAMLAVARTVADNRLTAFEFLRIVERDGTLVYIAQPDGRPPVEFALTSADGNSVTFENPAHDFPRMIRYTRQSDGRLEARISGTAGERAQSFLFTRQDAVR